MVSNFSILHTCVPSPAVYGYITVLGQHRYSWGMLGSIQGMGRVVIQRRWQWWQGDGDGGGTETVAAVAHRGGSTEMAVVVAQRQQWQWQWHRDGSSGGSSTERVAAVAWRGWPLWHVEGSSSDT